MTARAATSSNFPAVAALTWLGIAIAAGATGVLAQVPTPGPQLLIIALGIATVIAGLRQPALRDWVARVDLRILAGVHLSRALAGVVFFLFAAHGNLSPVFARNAGGGDIIVALLALVLITAVNPATRGGRAAWLAWNVVGVLDFVQVFTTAAVVGRSDPAAMAPLFHLPLSLIPTFVVPLLIASHVFVFRRLLLDRAA